MSDTLVVQQYIDFQRFEQVQYVAPAIVLRDVTPGDDPTWEQNLQQLPNNYKWGEFLADLAANGVQEPVHLIRRQLRNGHHRVQGAALVGLPVIPVVVHESYCEAIYTKNTQNGRSFRQW